MDFERVKHLEQEMERLRTEVSFQTRRADRAEQFWQGDIEKWKAAEARILELEADLEVANDKMRRLTDALTPSVETKAAYMGEFHMGVTMMHNGNEDRRRVMIPWTSIKEIMAATRARAVLGGQSNE